MEMLVAVEKRLLDQIVVGDKHTQDIIEARLDGITRATDLLQKQAQQDPSPFVLKGMIEKVEAVRDEKLNGLKENLNLLREQIDRESQARETALTAALATAKELVEKQNTNTSVSMNKSEGQFADAIRQLNILMNTKDASTTDKINALTAQVVALQSNLQGSLLQRQETGQHAQQNWGVVGVVVGAMIGAGGLAVAILKP